MISINGSTVKMVSLAIVLMASMQPLTVFSIPIPEGDFEIENLLNRPIALRMSNWLSILTAKENVDNYDVNMVALPNVIPGSGRWIMKRASKHSDNVVIQHVASGKFLEAIETPDRVQEVFSKPRNVKDLNQEWRIVPKFDDKLRIPVFHLISVPSGQALDASGHSGNKDIYLNPLQEFNRYQTWVGIRIFDNDTQE